MPLADDELEPSSNYHCETEGTVGGNQQACINILNQSMPGIKSPHVLNKLKTPTMMNKI